MNKFLYYAKIFLLSLVIALFAIVAAIENITHSAQATTTVQIKQEIDPKTAAIYATSSIIAREGKLSYQVAKNYAIWVYDAADKYSIDPSLILSVISVESRFDAKANNSQGLGLMQIVHYYHKEKASRSALLNPQINIDVGARILKEYSLKSKNETALLIRYNGSESSREYAKKVLLKKHKYDTEITSAVNNYLKT